ncbi:CBU_0592 family membrane protein [Acidocella sp.]|jgi:multidrug transporter EmrE-like cation transporter|uniref:CBU_0592 family membrane protein n=1 Tax=Acidocella sp. TaxID=50710 RepID=UPI002F423381
MDHGFLATVMAGVLELRGPDYVGLLGSGIVVAQYFLSVQGKLNTQGLAYPVFNIIGCLLLAFSLIYHFNTPSFFIEVFWVSVSLYAIIRNVVRRLA